MSNTLSEVKDGVPNRRWGAASAKPEASQRTGRVLVIEDDPDVAELIRYNLTKEGYEVTVSAKGIQGLEQAKASRPDMILLDIMVPELNGWEVCRRLKQDAELRGTPVIIVTGRAEEGDKVLGFEMERTITSPSRFRPVSSWLGCAPSCGAARPSSPRARSSISRWESSRSIVSASRSP